MTFKKLFISCVILRCIVAISMSNIRNKRLQRALMPLLGPKINKLRSVEICYDSVGCFEIPRHHNPLQRFPESPKNLETQFYLFHRNINFSKPQILSYNNFESIKKSKFRSEEPVKILVHGYMTKWDAPGALAGVRAYLDISSCNVILVDWEKGAKGPGYSSAAANTELVGRQLGLLLLHLLSLGALPHKIHLIGFSLGAHVAACAAEVVKETGHKIGRITGLDPASPLFKLNHFRDKRKKLDISDADFVDVIHTDGSFVFTDGFGILDPLGHVDFFPNGGREQPGCNDVRNSVVVSHFDKNLDKNIACSHIRAYQYFLETLLEKAAISRGYNNSGCSFLAYSCPGGPRDFALGRCFPHHNSLKANLTQLTQQHTKKDLKSLGKLGEDAFGQGVMYLTTNEAPPYCGMQIQLIINVSRRTRRIKGILEVILFLGQMKKDFLIFTDLTDFSNPQRQIFATTATNFKNMSQNLKNITLNILFNRLLLSEGQKNIRHVIFIDKVVVKTMTGRSWQFCGNFVLQQNVVSTMQLTTEVC